MFTKNKCSQGDALALLGGKGCSIGRMIGVAMWSLDTVFSDSFGKTQLDEKIKEGGFIGAVMADSIENNDTEPTYKETSMKVRTEVDKGRKGFKLMFEKTPCFHNELTKLDTSEDWGFTPILDDGSIFVYESKDGTRKPYPAKMFTGVYKLPIAGVEEQGTTLEIDILPKGLNYWQENGVVLSNDEIDFTEVKPIAGVNIESGVLVVGATTTKLKVSHLCSSYDVKGLTDVDNWKIERNGTLESVSSVSYDASSMEYTINHTALVATDKVRFVLSKNGQNIYVMDSNYYSGSSIIKTVV